MKAAWYEKPGTARDVLVVGEMDHPQPRAGESDSYRFFRSESGRRKEASGYIWHSNAVSACHSAQ
jgi:hypothetical protein